MESPRTPGEAWSSLEKSGAVPAEHNSRSRVKVVKKGGVSLVRALREYVEEHPEYMEHVVMGLIHKARQGDVKCAALLFDRLDGAVVRQLETKSEVVHVKRFGFAEPEFEVVEVKKELGDGE
jgi:hypothetical protein